MKCSRGNVKRHCCHGDVIENLKADYGARWVYYFNDSTMPPELVALAEICGLDPHDMDDDFQKRGWEYHDKGAFVQFLYAAINVLERTAP